MSREILAEIHAIARRLDEVATLLSSVSETLLKILDSVSSIAIPGKLTTVAAPIKPIKPKKLSVSDTSDAALELEDITKVVLISNPGGDIRIEFDKNTTDDSLIIPGGTVFVFYRSEETKKLYFRSISGTVDVYTYQFSVNK